MVLALVACASSDTGSASEGTTSGDGSSSDADTGDSSDAGTDGAKKQVTIIYNSSFGDQSQADAAGVWPDYEVEWVGCAENDMDSKILLEMVSGSKSYDLACTIGLRRKAVRLYGPARAVGAPG